MTLSRWWIQVIPRMQTSQTVVQMMMTPAQVGHFPSEMALSTMAPEVLFMAFQPVVAIMEKTTTRRLPQYPKEYRLHPIVNMV